MRLRTLQVRNDVIRTLIQRRLEGGRTVREIGPEPVKGRVVRSGYHDELGAQPFVLLRDEAGAEYYARLGLGGTPPRVGSEAVVGTAERGAAQVLSVGRGGPELSR